MTNVSPVTAASGVTFVLRDLKCMFAGGGLDVVYGQGCTWRVHEGACSTVTVWDKIKYRCQATINLYNTLVSLLREFTRQTLVESDYCC